LHGDPAAAATKKGGPYIPLLINESRGAWQHHLKKGAKAHRLKVGSYWKEDTLDCSEAHLQSFLIQELVQRDLIAPEPQDLVVAAWVSAAVVGASR
jgi:hypothetical protein